MADDSPDDAPPSLVISLEKLCFLIVKAREYDPEVPGGATEDGSNPADDREVGVLEDGGGSDVDEELAAALDGLNDDEKIEVLAMVWTGRGDFGAGEWAAALEQAAEVHDQRETAYLMGIPQLGDLLEDGMAQLGYSCEDVELNRL